MQETRKLDFLVVGAEKCGTTWLADMLKQHPQVFVPEGKELHYFNRKFVEFPDLDNFNFDKPLEWYLSFYKDAAPGQVKGEICPTYLWDLEAPSRIRDFEPGLKILILLRNPVERTFSAYRYYQQRGIIGRESLREAVANYHNILIERSQYFAQVKRYLDLFPPEQVRVWCLTKRGGMESMLREVETFLGVDEFVPANASARSNITGEPRNWLLNRALAYSRRAVRRTRVLAAFVDIMRGLGVDRRLEAVRRENVSTAAPTELSRMNEEEKAWLAGLLRPDVEQLESLLNVDLSEWK